ncbi:MAG: ABC transporter permease subunit [Candidatus Krumholzibacteriota bacterium]|nr:ABC transporter permease subunit [Candidatus Krumholzibacteriota bacterium]
MAFAGHVSHVFRKEFRVYFVTPIAYIVIAIFLVLTGWFFFSTFFLYDQAELRDFFGLLPVVFAFIVPAVTMRLFSEEYSVGSYEILITMPVTYVDVVLGKFLAATAFVAVMMLPTLSYAVSIAFLGDLDWGPVAGGYLGAILLGASFSAVGLFASALTRNQIVAFIIGMIICFAFTVVDKILFFLPESMLGFFQYVGADHHFQNVAKGIVDSRDIVYFLSFIFVALYAANLVIQEKK